MKYEYLMAGALAMGLWRPTGTAVAEPPRTEAERPQRQRRAGPPGDERRDRAEPQRERSEEDDTSSKGAHDEPKSERTSTAPKTTAAHARAAGEAARREATQSRVSEVEAPLRQRVPKRGAELKTSAKLAPVAQSHEPASEGTVKLDAHGPEPVVVPPYDDGAQPPTLSNETHAEQELREHIQAHLLDQEQLSRSARLLRVRVRGDVVTLSGQVATRHEKHQVEATVRALPEVRQVRSEIRARNRLGDEAVRDEPVK